MTPAPRRGSRCWRRRSRRCSDVRVTHWELRRNAWAICLFFERAEFKTDYSVPRLA